jgi:hypothetical protein
MLTEFMLTGEAYPFTRGAADRRLVILIACGERGPLCGTLLP